MEGGMLRPVIIGLAIAAVLQLGAQEFAPVASVSLGSQRVDWVAVQASALAHFVCDGHTLLAR
jgi:hypothetical protein